jgi:hypothetical protein
MVLDVKDQMRKRNTLSSQIKAVIKKADNHDTNPLTVIDIESYLETTLPKYTEEASNLHELILDECTDDSLVDDHINQLTRHEELIHEAEVKLKQIKVKVEPKASAPKVAELVRKRDLIYKEINTIKTRMDNHATNPLTLELAECDLAETEAMKVKSDAIMEELISLHQDSKVAQETANKQKLSETFREVVATLKRIIKDASPRSASSGAGGGGSGSANHVKLPVIQLPTFEG